MLLLVDVIQYTLRPCMCVLTSVSRHGKRRRRPQGPQCRQSRRRNLDSSPRFSRNPGLIELKSEMFRINLLAIFNFYLFISALAVFVTYYFAESIGTPASPPPLATRHNPRTQCLSAWQASVSRRASLVRTALSHSHTRPSHSSACWCTARTETLLSLLPRLMWDSCAFGFTLLSRAIFLTSSASHKQIHFESTNCLAFVKRSRIE